jgi:4-hydroxybenzoate polyprenyltransferase
MTAWAKNKKTLLLRKILESIWNEFIYGGHLISLGPSSIAYIYMKLNDLPISWQVLIGIYLITYIVHLLDRYIDIQGDSSSDRSEYYEKMKKALPWILMSAVTFLVLVFVNNFIMILFAVFLILAGASYTLIFKKLTRYILGFKSYYTAAVFAMTVIFTALFYSDFSLTPILIILYLFFFFRWFSNTVFCDLKDIDEDRKKSLKTFASQLSNNNLYVFLYVINIISMIVIIIGVLSNNLPTYTLSLMAAPIYSFYYLMLSHRQKANYQKLANVWADGESLVWLTAILIGGVVWA